MAALSLLLIAAVALLLSPVALSLTCTSQTFSHPNTKFANCTDLPTLKAFLHWNYDAAARPNPTLSVAFIAPPAKPDGWVAWGLNPTSAGMVGAQSFVAFKDTNGSIVVKTYNISSYGPITESKISYDVLNKRAEASRGLITIFATVALPAGAPELNQVWQVGSAVNNGVPAKHDFAPDNLNSKTKLELVSAAENGDEPAPAPGIEAAPGGGRQSGSESGGSAVIVGLGLYGVCVLLGVTMIFGF